MAKPIQSYVIASATRMMRSQLTLNKPVIVTQKSNYSDAYRALGSQYRFGEVYFLRVDGYEPGTASDSTTLSGAIRPYALANKGLTSKVNFKRMVGYSEVEDSIRKSSKQYGNGVSTTTYAPRSATVIKILPVIFKCTFLLATADSNQQSDFFSRWMFASIHGRLSFNLAYEDLNLWCDVVLPRDMMNVGERSDVPDSTNRFLMYEGQIDIGGWFMNPNDFRDYKDVNLINSINIGSNNIK